MDAVGPSQHLFSATIKWVLYLLKKQTDRQNIGGLEQVGMPCLALQCHSDNHINIYYCRDEGQAQGVAVKVGINDGVTSCWRFSNALGNCNGCGRRAKIQICRTNPTLNV